MLWCGFLWVFYISCLIYNWVLTWKDLTTPITRWQGYFRVFQTLPRQLEEWDKQGFLASARLFMWLHRQRCLSGLNCPQEGILQNEGIRLMQAQRRREPDECIYSSICVHFVCVRGKIIPAPTDFPGAFYLTDVLPFLFFHWFIGTQTLTCTWSAAIWRLIHINTVEG